MDKDNIASHLAILHAQIEDMKIRLDPSAEIVQQIDLVRAYLADKANLSIDQIDAKWKDRFSDFYKAQLSVAVLSRVISELVNRQKESLGKYLKIILGGSLTQGGPPGGQPRDWFYELWLASALSEAGFIILLQEPDLVIEGNGLSQPIGVACKYPSSDKGIHAHLSKGLSQLRKRGLHGFVAFGIDQIVVERANLKRYVDFNAAGNHPIEVLQKFADSELRKLVEDRPVMYPSEAQVDDLLITLSLVGHYGKPATFVSPTAFSIYCSDNSPIKSDIHIIAEALRRISWR